MTSLENGHQLRLELVFSDMQGKLLRGGLRWSRIVRDGNGEGAVAVADRLTGDLSGR